MMFLLLNLLQPQQGRISRVVIIGAVVVFIAGVSLLVYFYRKYRHIEKESEEDWDLSRRSLFVNVAPPSSKTEEPASAAAEQVSAPVPQHASVEAVGTRELTSVAESPSPAPASPAPTEPVVEQPAVLSPILEDRSTQVLASPSPQEREAKPEEPEVTPFDDEVWAGLETSERPRIISEQVQVPVEPTKVAPVIERTHRETFEPPRIEPVLHREPYEPPGIEPLAPREQAVVSRELDSTARVSRDASRATLIFGSARRSQTRESATQPAQTPPVPIREPAIATGRAGSARRAPTGSVLGLPAEVSPGPLILGEPVRPASEGIGALSHYGEDPDQKSGRAGTIMLVVVLFILGGALALYLFVPPVHSRVRAFVEHVRGVDTQRAIQDSMTPKAIVIPSYRPEVNKNLVKARGAVDNISDQPLENLTIEVSLQRGGDAPPETRTVQVTPNPLPPNQRGTFEFEYDGKRDTGFAGYKITKLFSNDKEIKFRAPGQK